MQPLIDNMMKRMGMFKPETIGKLMVALNAELDNPKLAQELRDELRATFTSCAGANGLLNCE